MSRDHGRHNQVVCGKLHLTTDIPCNDWVITTAFYSAIHFIDHFMFPVEYAGTKLNNINEAHRIIKKDNKHSTREFLVNTYLKSQSANYSFLMSECWNARYANYDINEAIANLAVKKLQAIMKECDVDKKVAKKK